jgi:hypothetical protein
MNVSRFFVFMMLDRAMRGHHGVLHNPRARSLLMKSPTRSNFLI